MTKEREAIIKYFKWILKNYKKSTIVGAEAVVGILEVCISDMEERHPDTLPPKKKKKK